MEIAIIGTGIAGLAAAWKLHGEHVVSLYEAASHVGGHCHTVEVEHDGRCIPVDTGFIVYNETNYPGLTSLFDELDVCTRASDMSFAVSIGDGAIEYAGDNLATLFGQPRNLWRASHWRMLAQILRFNERAQRLLEEPLPDGLTLGQFLAIAGLSGEMARRYLLPMGAAIWSCAPSRMLDFPARTLLRFFDNHGLLNPARRPGWRTVAGGSREYVRRLVARLGVRTRVATPVLGVERDATGVTVRDASGATQRYDQVVFACHSDQALALLDRADRFERAVLGGFSWSRNRVVLHGDAALMPRRRRLWASWNYLARGERPGADAVSVSYWMNRLQRLETEQAVFVSLNPLIEPDPARVHAELEYSHPQLDHAALRAQRELPRLQGRRRSWYCGAWTGNGFHEDGLRSGLEVARLLGSPAERGMDAAGLAATG